MLLITSTSQAIVAYFWKNGINIEAPGIEDCGQVVYGSQMPKSDETLVWYNGIAHLLITRRKMPAKDTYHDAVKNALIKDGWSILADPYKIKYKDAEFLLI